MRRLVVYIINVDEDIAEKAFDKTIAALKTIDLVSIDSSSIVVEPHDDYRGVIARFDYSFTNDKADESKPASKALQDSIQSLIELNLFNITNVKVTLQSVGVSN